MANPTSFSASGAAVVAVSTTAVSVTLDPAVTYDIQHEGVDASGSSSTGTVFIGVNGTTATATYAGGDGIGYLLSGKSRVIGPGVSSISLLAASGTVSVTLTSGAKA